MSRNTRRPAAQPPERPAGRTTQVLGTVVFALISLLFLTAILQSYLSKVPGFDQAVSLLSAFGTRYIGLYTFLAVLAGMLLAVFFSRAPEASFHGFKFPNPFHRALSAGATAQHETERAAWQQEKQRLVRRVADLEGQLNTAREQLRAVRADKEVAASSKALYEFALERSSHQDSVIERLMSAFYQPDAEFDAAYNRAMDWLAHFATQLVANYDDRTRTCQVLSYNAETSQWTVAGDSKPGAADHTPQVSLVFAGKVLAEGAPLIVGDLGGHRDLPHSPRSLLTMPVFHHRRVAGVVSLYSGRREAFSPGDLHTVQMAVDLAAIAMGLYRIRRTDRRGAALMARLNELLTEESGPKGGDSP